MQIEQLSKRVSITTGKSEDVIEEVHRSMFKFLLEHFKQRNNQAVNCIYLGKFLKNGNYDELGNSRKHIRRMEEPSV